MTRDLRSARSELQEQDEADGRSDKSGARRQQDRTASAFAFAESCGMWKKPTGSQEITELGLSQQPPPSLFASGIITTCMIILLPITLFNLGSTMPSGAFQGGNHANDPIPRPVWQPKDAVETRFVTTVIVISEITLHEKVSHLFNGRDHWLAAEDPTRRFA